MFTSTIRWGDGQATITQKDVPSLLHWLTNLYDATGQMPDVFDNANRVVRIGYNERGRAYLA